MLARLMTIEQRLLKSAPLPFQRVLERPSTPMHYDRQGRVMSFARWAAEFEVGLNRRVAETTLENGIWISTVWLGLDHSCGPGRPLIFESMVFGGKARKDMEELDGARYSTEAEARAGHAEMVTRWRERSAWANEAVGSLR